MTLMVAVLVFWVLFNIAHAPPAVSRRLESRNFLAKPWPIITFTFVDGTADSASHPYNLYALETLPTDVGSPNLKTFREFPSNIATKTVIFFKGVVWPFDNKPLHSASCDRIAPRGTRVALLHYRCELQGWLPQFESLGLPQRTNLQQRAKLMFKPTNRRASILNSLFSGRSSKSRRRKTAARNWHHAAETLQPRLNLSAVTGLEDFDELSSSMLYGPVGEDYDSDELIYFNDEPWLGYFDEVDVDDFDVDSWVEEFEFQDADFAFDEGWGEEFAAADEDYLEFDDLEWIESDVDQWGDDEFAWLEADDSWLAVSGESWFEDDSQYWFEDGAEFEEQVWFYDESDEFTFEEDQQVWLDEAAWDAEFASVWFGEEDSWLEDEFWTVDDYADAEFDFADSQVWLEDDQFEDATWDSTDDSVWFEDTLYFEDDFVFDGAEWTEEFVEVDESGLADTELSDWYAETFEEPVNDFWGEDESAFSDFSGFDFTPVTFDEGFFIDEDLGFFTEDFETQVFDIDSEFGTEFFTSDDSFGAPGSFDASFASTGFDAGFDDSANLSVADLFDTPDFQDEAIRSRQTRRFVPDTEGVEQEISRLRTDDASADGPVRDVRLQRIGESHDGRVKAHRHDRFAKAQHLRRTISVTEITDDVAQTASSVDSIAAANGETQQPTTSHAAASQSGAESSRHAESHSHSVNRQQDTSDATRNSAVDHVFATSAIATRLGFDSASGSDIELASLQLASEQWEMQFDDNDMALMPTGIEGAEEVDQARFASLSAATAFTAFYGIRAIRSRTSKQRKLAMYSH